MKNYVMFAFALLILFSSCSSNKQIEKTSAKPDIRKFEKINFWLDEETGTVHKITFEKGVAKATSIIKYRDGKPLEVMKIISSENNNGKIHWIYFSPSTKYVVELTAVLIGAKEINVEWKNRTPEGIEDSGTDRFVKCNENGSIEGKENSNSEDSDLTDDLSSFDKME